MPSTIYGPVDSWRLGRSLGVDVLCVDSICSFECVYCQLGKINRVTVDREIFVTTDRIIADLEKSDWRASDVVTFSGSGEPSLALNLGEAINRIRAITGKPIIVLTNSTLLDSKQVRSEIGLADRVFCKLDAWSDDVLRRVDRPHEGISLESIVDGIKKLRREYDGFLAIQTMILRPPSKSEIESFAGLLNSIGPDEVQLNLPTRPIPHSYFVETRGNEVADEPGFTHLKTITHERLEHLRMELSRLTDFPIVAR